MRNMKVWVYAAVAGIAGIAAGLAIDAQLHAADHTLAVREGVFALGNPGHVLLGIGIALVTVAVAGLVVLTHLPSREAASRPT